MKREMDRFRAKVEAGAEYAVTQPVFDIACLRRFCESVESTGIPIIAGIWPFTSYKNAEFMANEVPGVSVPGDILERMSMAKTRPEGIKRGIEIAQEMIRGVSGCVSGVAISAPFGNISIALAVLGKGEVSF
jgi:homocysteine S-methyltransferase